MTDDTTLLMELGIDPSRIRERLIAIEGEAIRLRVVLAALDEAGDPQPREMVFEAHRAPLVVAPRDPDGPRGTAAVLKLMEETPRRTWKVIELKRELLARGWATTPKAVEANVKRLRLAGEIISPSYGHYCLSRGAITALASRAA
jgi:hypothetical protein